MIRFSLVLITAFFMSHAFADEMQKEATSLPQAGAAVDTNEAIVVNHDLAAHMGWGDQQAVFKSPRNFRSQGLNEISPDNLDDSANGVNN